MVEHNFVPHIVLRCIGWFVAAAILVLNSYLIVELIISAAE